MTNTYRAFIAIELPESVRSALGKVQEALKIYGFRVKWVRPQSIHLTLKFLGNIDAAYTDAVVNAMLQAASGCGVLDLIPGGIGVFPHVRRPRVIWVGIDGQLDRLMRLQHSLDSHLVDLGFPKESRPFKGHLTLGRVKGKIPAGRMREALEKCEKFEAEGFEASHMNLFKSELQPTGAVYTQIKQVPLDG